MNLIVQDGLKKINDVVNCNKGQSECKGRKSSVAHVELQTYKIVFTK